MMEPELERDFIKELLVFERLYKREGEVKWKFYSIDEDKVSLGKDYLYHCIIDKVDRVAIVGLSVQLILKSGIIYTDLDGNSVPQLYRYFIRAISEKFLKRKA